jgi:hypothetical protein
MTMLLLAIFLAGSYIQTAPGKTTTVQRLIGLCCVALFVWPLLLLALGGHYWWNSRIYLTFPVLVLFIVGLGFELYVSGTGVGGPRPAEHLL